MAVRRDPIPPEFAEQTFGGTNHKDGEYSSGLGFQSHLSDSRLSWEKLVGINRRTSQPFGMHPNQGSWSSELSDSPVEAVAVEYRPTPVVQDRWKHAHPSQEDVDANANQIVIDEIGTYREKESTREASVPDDRPHDHEEVEDGPVVCQQ
jgi:hypothetical protein